MNPDLPLGNILYVFNIASITACIALAASDADKHSYGLALTWCGVAVFKVLVWWAGSAFLRSWARRHGQ